MTRSWKVNAGTRAMLHREVLMRAEEGDESIRDFAGEAQEAKSNVAPEAPWWSKLWRRLAFWRSE
jgi:hypothetical protein